MGFTWITDGRDFFGPRPLDLPAMGKYMGEVAWRYCAMHKPA